MKILFGLKYLKTELSRSKDPIAIDSMSVINDLESASEIAVTTLDDILTYDKLSSNIKIDLLINLIVTFCFIIVFYCFNTFVFRA